MSNITINHEKNVKLTSFGKAVLLDRYLIENESYQDLFIRIASYYSDNKEHAQRLYDYISNLWFMPSTPILSNGGTNRGLPISCFLNETEDSLQGIVDLWNENVWLAARGGGIGSIGEIYVQLAKVQGSLRRGSSAVYLPVSHPEIEEFLDIRKPTGGDPNRKALNIHHAVIVNDEFMQAVERDLEWDLISPHSNKVISTVKARYDHLNKPRTAVCCLSSVNLEYYEEWKDSEFFIEDIMRFLDNVFEDFINKAPNEIQRAKYSAMRERSIGLGVMGFHSFLQSKMVPFESVTAQQWNKRIFKHLREQADIVLKKLAEEKGACLDAKKSI
ncbi:unnamed protein product [Ceratitis capitata]|uniref:Ribonucleoside-diphosphate reductase n=1 Tax=Ceratitis capitata TaxID=7213 RepID=A0A811UET6_CERCA|nr:unnamed protein product [Ceratitis capitata]